MLRRMRNWWPWIGGVAAITAVVFAAGWVTYPRPDVVRTFYAEPHVWGSYPRPPKIQVDCFFPRGQSTGDKPLPAVILLHGVEGTSYYRRLHLNNARQIADEGYAVFFVHYFDPLPYHDLVYLDGRGELDKAKVEEHMYGSRKAERQVWIDACAQAVRWVAEQPETASDQIAIIGYSLGGFVALSAADQCVNREDLPDPCCVVVNSGSRFKDIALSDKMPPLQFHHGVKDKVVFIRYARGTVRDASSLGVSVSLHEYADQGHMLKGQAADDCRAITYKYLRERLPQHEE